MVQQFAPHMNEGGAVLSLTYLASTTIIPGYGGGMSSAKAVRFPSPPQLIPLALAIPNSGIPVSISSQLAALVLFPSWESWVYLWEGGPRTGNAHLQHFLHSPSDLDALLPSVSTGTGV